MPFNDFYEQDDAVVARLEVDLPDDADVQVKELVDLTDDLQTNVEAATRYTSDLSKRIENVTETQDRLNEAKEKFVEVSEKERALSELSTRDFVESNSESLQRLDEQLKMTEAMQERVESLQRTINDRNVTPEMRSLAEERLGIELRTQDPDTLYDLAYSKGLIDQKLKNGRIQNLYKGRDFSEVVEDDSLVTQMRDELSMANNEERTGVDWGDLAGSIGDTAGALGGLANVQDAQGALRGLGGVAGAASGIGALGALGAAVPYLAAAAAVAGAVKIGVDQYVDSTNWGRIQGGGYSEGAEKKADAYKMAALNPFISNDQAREMIMTAMNEGYSGDAYEDVTDFMAKNLEDMNIKVADSMRLVKMNVEEGGQSIEELSLQLQTLQGVSKETGLSVESLAQGYEKTVGAFAKTGADVGELGRVASVLDSNSTEGPLKGQAGGDIYRQMLTSETGQYMLGEKYREAKNPREATRMMIDEGPEGVNAMLTRMVQDVASQSGGDVDMFIDLFNSYYGTDIGYSQAEELMKLAEGDSILEGGIESLDEAEEKELEEQDVSGLDDTKTKLKSASGVGSDILKETFVKGGAWETLLNSNLYTIPVLGQVKLGRDLKKAAKKVSGEIGGSELLDFTDGKSRYEALDMLVDEHGAGSIDVILEDGERININEARKRRGLDLKKARFVEAGGDESEARGYSEFKGAKGVDEATDGDQTSVKIDLTDEAKEILKVDKIKSGRTPHMEKSFSGAEGRRLNNKPVGEE